VKTVKRTYAITALVALVSLASFLGKVHWGALGFFDGR